MTDAKMTRVTDSDKLLFGPRKILLCGFLTAEQKLFSDMLDRELDEAVPMVCIMPEDAETSLESLFSCDELRESMDSRMPKTIIMGGIRENELRQIMRSAKPLNIGPNLWAVLTPTSQEWTLRQLIVELQNEHKKMQEQTRRN